MTGRAAKDEEQEAAEAEVDAFRQKLGPFVVAAESTRMAMAFTDAKKAENPIIFANQSFLELTGYDRAQVLAQPFDFILPLEAAAQVRTEIDAAFTNSPVLDSDIRFSRKDGGEGWASLFVTPVRDEKGAIIQHFLSLADTTRYKQAEQNAALLIDELNHRVKNTLASVEALIAEAFKASHDPGEIRESLAARIAALSRAHELLSRNSWQGVGLSDLIAETLRTAADSAASPDHHSLEGENFRLTPKATLSLGIALNELVTNATRFGALSNEHGKVGVSWSLDPRRDDGRLTLHWRETGGPPVSPPTHKGYGLRIIERGVPHELGGKTSLEFLPEGVVCTIEIPAKRALLDA